MKKPKVRKSASYWKKQEKNGRACTVWFAKREDLIDHIYGKVSPKDANENDFSLKSVNVMNNAMLKNRLKPEDKRNDVYSGNWYDFRELDHGKWIMRG